MQTYKTMEGKMSSKFESGHLEGEDYGLQYQPDKGVKVIKKDGSLEAFNVQKVIDAVGKSAYRALTKFTEEETSWARRRFPFRSCTISWKARWRMLSRL